MQGVIVIFPGNEVEISSPLIWREAETRLVLFITQEPKLAPATVIAIERMAGVKCASLTSGFAEGIGWPGFDLMTAKLITERYRIAHKLRLVCDLRDVDALARLSVKLFPDWNIELVTFLKEPRFYARPVACLLRWANSLLLLPGFRTLFSLIRSQWVRQFHPAKPQ